MKPFAASPPVGVIEDSYSLVVCAIVSQVMANSVTWDIVDGNSDVMRAGCEQGYFDPGKRAYAGAPGALRGAE
jgi:hypothetical protein